MKVCHIVRLIEADGWYQVAWLSFYPSVTGPGATMIASSIPARLLAVILGVIAATAAAAKERTPTSAPAPRTP